MILMAIDHVARVLRRTGGGTDARGFLHPLDYRLLRARIHISGRHESFLYSPQATATRRGFSLARGLWLVLP